MTVKRPTAEGEFEDESTLDEEEPSHIDAVDALVVSEDTYDDEGTGGAAFGDAPIDDETPVDDLIGLAEGDGDPGIDELGDDSNDDTTLPPDAGDLGADEADTPADDDAGREGLDEEITLPPGPEDPDEEG